MLIPLVIYAPGVVWSIVARGIITSAEGGYVFTSVCLSVCLSLRRITEKVVNGF